MNYYKVTNWNYYCNTPPQVMFILAADSRKARELFVEVCPGHTSLQVRNINNLITSSLDINPNQGWYGEERGYSEWLRMIWSVDDNTQLKSSEFTRFQSRREKIRSLLK